MELSTNVLIFCILSLYVIIPVSSQFHFGTEFCQDVVGNYTVNSTYHNNLNLMLSSLTTQAELSLFNNGTVGQGIDRTYGLFMCRGDLTVAQCHDCVKNASTTILDKCPDYKEAIMWFSECMVRYANRDIFSRFEDDPVYYTWSNKNFSDREKFGEIYSETVNGLIKQAAYNTSSRGYAIDQANVTLFETVYVVAQCTPDIVGSQCERCLRVASRNMGGCCGKSSMNMEMYMPSCWLYYAQAPIVGEFGKPPDGTQSSSSASADDSPLSRVSRSTSMPSPPSPGSSTAATITSGGISLIFGVLMAVTGISLSTAL